MNDNDSGVVLEYHPAPEDEDEIEQLEAEIESLNKLLDVVEADKHFFALLSTILLGLDLLALAIWLAVWLL